MLVIAPHIKIPYSEFEFSYARSSGTGGQNVNKVNSKAVLRWNIQTSPSLTDVFRTRILNRIIPSPNAEGEIVIASDRFRDQNRNREDCLEKLREKVLKAVHVPKARKKTKPTLSSQKKRVDQKSKHSAKKNWRRSPRSDDH